MPRTRAYDPLNNYGLSQDHIPQGQGPLLPRQVYGLGSAGQVLIQPAIADFTLAQHNHENAAGGGTLGNGIITNAMLSAAAGEVGAAWQSWTPTLSGQFTDGDWTKTCFYLQIGKIVIFRFFLRATDATPMAGGSGNATFTLPVTAASYPGSVLAPRPVQLGLATLVDAAPAFYQGNARLASTTTADIMINNTSGTYAQNSGVTSSAPFTWTTNDEIHAQGFYEAE